MTRGLFATMIERADTKEAIGLNRSHLRSTRPVETSSLKIQTSKKPQISNFKPQIEAR